MLTRMNSRTLTLALIAGALAGTPALAQSMFDRPLKNKPAADENVTSQSSSRLSMIRTEGGDTYEVTIEGGEVSAKVNGEKVPKDRVRRDGDSVELLDKDGDVLTRFEVGAVKVEPGAFAVSGLGGAWVSGPGGIATFTPGAGGGFGGPVDVVMSPPKVMLGVTMLEPSEALAEQLDIEPGTGVLLERVVDGLPADKAGLKKGDVVVSFDGQKPVTVEKIRDVLANKKAGEKVKVVILRKGEETAATVELQKYDPQRFEMAGAINRDPQAGARADLDAAREAMRAGQAQAHKELEEAMRIYRNQLKSSGAKGYVFGPGDGGLEVFAAPGGGDVRARLSALDKKLADLDEKVSRLDEQLDRLEEKLDRLNRGR